MAGALIRYRAITWIVGFALLLLVAVAMPLKYLADKPLLVGIIAPIHGFLFIVYLLATFDLGRRANWPLTRMAVVMLAGVVPLLFFFTERSVTREINRVLAPA